MCREPRLYWSQSVFSRIISSAQLSQRLVKLLAEVLGHHGREDAAREVVRRALSEVCATFDADDPIQLELFANGELADAVADVVGPDHVDEVVAFVIRTAARPTSESPPLARKQVDTLPDAHRASPMDEASQPLALVITEDDAIYEEAMRVLDGAGILCFECGSDPLEVVSESRALDASYLVYDADVSPDHPATLCAHVRRALREDTPRAVVLIDDDHAHLDINREGWIAGIRKRRFAVDLVDTLRRVEGESRQGRSPSLPQAKRRRRTGGRRTGAGAAAMARRGRRTFDHVLGEALGSVANDRILEVVLENALSTAGMKSIPTSAAKFEAFVGGPLRESVSDLLGDDAFAAVRGALQPVITQAVSINYQRRQTSTTNEPEGGTFGRILVVHRDERTVTRLATILARHGDEVLTATDGYVALGMMMRHSPNLVIVDADMPAVSGEELIAQAGKMHGAEAPPVIVIGEHTPGAAKMVSAPVKPRELIAAVAELQRGQM